MHPIAGAPQEKIRQQEALRPQLESSPHSLQLQKAQGQQRRPSTAKNKNKLKKIFKDKTKAKDKRPTGSSGAPGPIYAKPLQSRLTLCDPIDSSPPGSAVPGILPGKNAGVGCHFLLQCMKVKSESEVAQSCSTLRDPMDYSLPGSSVHGILQARVLESVAIAFFLCFTSSLNLVELLPGCCRGSW